MNGLYWGYYNPLILTFDPNFLRHPSTYVTFMQDSFIADLVVGLRTGQIKTGAPCRSERRETQGDVFCCLKATASNAVLHDHLVVTERRCRHCRLSKYNQLLRIEEELGDKCRAYQIGMRRTVYLPTFSMVKNVGKYTNVRCHGCTYGLFVEVTSNQGTFLGFQRWLFVGRFSPPSSFFRVTFLGEF